MFTDSKKKKFVAKFICIFVAIAMFFPIFGYYFSISPNIRLAVDGNKILDSLKKKKVEIPECKIVSGDYVNKDLIYRVLLQDISTDEDTLKALSTNLINEIKEQNVKKGEFNQIGILYVDHTKETRAIFGYAIYTSDNIPLNPRNLKPDTKPETKKVDPNIQTQPRQPIVEEITALKGQFNGKEYRGYIQFGGNNGLLPKDNKDYPTKKEIDMIFERQDLINEKGQSNNEDQTNQINKKIMNKYQVTQDQINEATLKVFKR